MHTLKKIGHFLVFILGTYFCTWLVLAICVSLPLLGFIWIYDWGDFWFLFVGGILVTIYYLIVFALLSWYYEFVGKTKPDYWFSNIFLVLVAGVFFCSFIMNFAPNFLEETKIFGDFKGIVFLVSVLPAYLKILFVSLIAPFMSKARSPIAKRTDSLHTTRLQQLIIDQSDDKSILAISRKLLELAVFFIPIKPQMAKAYADRFYNDRTTIEFAIFFYMHFEIYLIGILDEDFRSKMDRVKQDYIDTFSKVYSGINFDELIKDRLILYQKRCAGVRPFVDETVKMLCLLVFETQDSKRFSLHTDDFIMLSSSAIENMLFQKQVKDYLRALDQEGKLEFLKLRAENLFR